MFEFLGVAIAAAFVGSAAPALLTHLCGHVAGYGVSRFRRKMTGSDDE